MSKLPWHKHYHADALNGMAALPVDLRGVYYTILDLIYDRRGPLAESDSMMAARMCCSKAKWRKYRSALVASGKIEITEDGIYAPVMVKWKILSGRTSLPASVRLAIFERDEWTCVYCGTDEAPFHVDHVFPVSQGGTDDLENLVCACAPCNLGKGALTLEEWRVA